MKMCLRVLTECNKSRFDSATVVRNSVSIISHITLQDCLYPEIMPSPHYPFKSLTGRGALFFFPSRAKETKTPKKKSAKKKKRLISG